MRYLPELFANNRAWAARLRQQDPEFFARTAASQDPSLLWIGCADSRVPPNEIVGLPPGELFVHRNVANLVMPSDHNVLAVLHFAIEALQVRHVIVCGHYGCGGVQAALGVPQAGPVEQWIAPIRDLRRRHAAELDAMVEPSERWRRLCELNVVAQVHALRRLLVTREAWRRGQELVLHGWVYDLGDGLLRDLDVSTAG